MIANDLQPKQLKITIQGKEYNCKPPRLSHRLIIGRIQPLFKAAEDMANGKQTEVSAEDMIQYENDLDTMIQDLMPELKGVTLDITNIIEIISQLLEAMLPAESKELKDAKVEVNDPKVMSEAKI